MVISHIDPKFLFVHVYKTAGTSMRLALQECALSDEQKQANIEAEQKGEEVPFNVTPLVPHAIVPEIADFLGGRDEFEKYQSVAVVRNQWDWQVSLYKFCLKTEDHPQHELFKTFGNFENYIQWRCTEEVRFQKDFLCFPGDNKVGVSRLLRFENIAEDFANFCNDIGIDAKLPKVNVSNTKPWRDFYNDETRKLVEETFAPDIEFFGYSWELG